jgi:undecaprenyl-diphosphatase
MLRGAAAVSGGVIGTMALLDAVLAHRRVVALDRHLHNFFRQHRTRRSEKVVDATTKVGSGWVVYPASLAAAAAFLRANDRRAAIASLWSVAGGGILSEALKNVVRRRRPAEGVEEENGYSFPSGHTLLSGSLFGLLAYLLSQRDELGHWRYPSAAVLALLTPWIAFSRMYLGRHWPSDTVASAALATAWNGTLITFLRSR